uniref:ZP domain-containing protein n=1 Tax=Dicentrarchus labrax TaxID=13489 RepID=A0A8C4E9V1_DICLA
MRTAAFIIGLILICCEFTEKTTVESLEEIVQSECRDRYLWIHVASPQTPRFEAVDRNGVHSISEHLASRCGYTISTFKMDGFTTFRASYYSCFTHNQVAQPLQNLSFENLALKVLCLVCGVQAQRTASSVWQLMILQSDGPVSSMSISEAQRWGYGLSTSAQRVVLRSQYKQPHTELTMVGNHVGVPMEVVRVSLFFKQKLTVVMIDINSAGPPSDSGSFDGARLLWDVPWVVTPLVREEAGFESQSLSLGVEGVMLDKPTAAARGFSLVQQGHLIQIGVPFGAEGGYRKSLVVNNVYKEMYVIFLLYEHLFSLLYEDGSNHMHNQFFCISLDSLDFLLVETISDDQVFSVYLGNIPADVLLEEVRINGKQLLMSESADRGYSISSFVHINGTPAYKLRLPFEDAIVHWMYLGQGIVQYSIEINFTLTIMPQRDSYYHQTFITARVFNSFPTEITAQCSDRGITFSMVRPTQAQSLWEVGIDHEPLTSQLAAQRGYRLDNNPQRTILEVPVFSIGYIYEDIKLSNFYGTFKLLLRDSKTLEVQTSTSKRCLFKTQDMIVCSADGTMTVVTTPTSTWPTVQPERTTLLDPTCGPKQTDGSRVLFEFKLDSCGTRVGELYVVYENEILHDRQMIADGPNFISRESQFKLTVRCFYPLTGVARLSVDRIFTSGNPGFGSVKVFKSVKGHKLQTFFN